MKLIITASTALALLAGGASAQANQINDAPATRASAMTTQTLVKASTLHSNKELRRAGLEANDLIEVTILPTKQVKASAVLSNRELSEAGLNADDLIPVSVASTPGNTQPQGGDS